VTKLLFATAAAAGLFLAGSSTQAEAGYAPYGCAPTPVYGYAPAYVPVYRTAVVPVVPVYAPPHRHHHHHYGSGLQIRTPNFSFGYYR
jgi:hypothetical protein